MALFELTDAEKKVLVAAEAITIKLKESTVPQVTLLGLSILIRAFDIQNKIIDAHNEAWRDEDYPGMVIDYKEK